MVAIIDEEAARLDLLIGDAVEMAEIDANAVQVRLPRSIRVRCSNRRSKSRARPWLGIVSPSCRKRRERRISRPGSIRTCSAGCCATCLRMRRRIRLRGAASR